MHPTARFAIITDTHYVYPHTQNDSTLWNRQLLSQSAELGRALADQISALQLDFVLHLGDLTHDGDEPSFHFAKSVFERFGCPYYFTIGNHDTTNPHARAYLKDLFSLPSPQFSNEVRVDGLRLVFLDCCFAHHHDGSYSEGMDWKQARNYKGIGPRPAELEWLRSTLSRESREPTILVCHYPIVIKDHYPRRIPREPADPSQRIAPITSDLLFRGQPEVLKICQSSPSLSLILNGHWHINDAVLDGAVPALQCPSLIEYPFAFRLAERYLDRIEFSTVPLEVAGIAHDSFVEEWQNRWVEGSSADQRVTIPLRRYAKAI